MRKIYNFLHLATELGNKYKVNLPPNTIAVLGSYNTGKSTLINKLLGTNFSPVDIIPSTNGVILFKYGKNFSAKVYTGKLKPKIFWQANIFIQYISGLNNSFEQAEVYINNPLLKKFNLVDTPGLDGPFLNNRILKKIIEQSDYLVYLFHQRGMEEFNKQFLQQLSTDYKQKKNPLISFWINCNLGNFDGASLKETRLELKTIFPGQFQINTLYLQNQENLSLCKTFLEMNRAAKVLERVKKVMLQKDQELQKSIAGIVKINNDTEFILKFNQLQKTAAELLQNWERLNSFHNIWQRLEKLFHTNNRPNLQKPASLPDTSNLQKKSLNFQEFKKLLLDLIEQVLKEPLLKPQDSRALVNLAGEIKKEHFTIVATGGFSSGKSTFFNALMGEEILPAQSKPTTFAITQISYGSHKKAVISFAPRVTLQLYDRVKGKIEPRSDELNTVTQWLLDDNTELISYEIYKNRQFKTISRQECLNVLQSFKLLSCHLPGNLTGPVLYKTVSSKLIALNPLVEKIRITFKPSRQITFDLSTKTGREAFQFAVNCTNAFRIERVQVYHPAEYFKLASFLDTPGLDSTHKYHSEITTDYLQNSDAYLIFFNARHLLINGECNNPIKIISNRIRDYLKTNSPACQKIFIILNFADTLTRAEQRKVIKYINQLLFIKETKTQVHIISSLSALLKKDDGSFQKLLTHIENTVLNYRGREILSGYIKEIRYILNIGLNPGTGENTKLGPNLKLLKFSASHLLLKDKAELCEEINNRFDRLNKIINELNSEQDFTGFLKGTREQRKGLLFKKEEAVSCPSYFSWATDLNKYITGYCTKITGKAEEALNRQLNQIPASTTLHLNAAPPQVILISPLHQKLTTSLERNRGLFGRIREREIRRDLYNMLINEQHNLIINLNKWLNKLLEEIIFKLNSIYAGLIFNSTGFDKEPQTLPAEKKYDPVLKKYLHELKKIEAMLEHPGGNYHGKRENPG